MYGGGIEMVGRERWRLYGSDIKMVGRRGVEIVWRWYRDGKEMEVT